MRVFLTSNDLPDVNQPIECEVINDWDRWESPSVVLVEIASPFTVSRDGREIEVARLMLSPVEGSHRPSAFFRDHTWVDMFLPAEPDGHPSEMTVRLCVGLMHRTTAAAQEYLPQPTELVRKGSDNTANSIEDAALLHIDRRCKASLGNLYRSLLSGTLVVPLFAALTKDAAGRTDVPVRCIRLADGEVCVPVFTSVDRLLEWKKDGSKYTEMCGRRLFEMVTAMPEIDFVFVNYSDVGGAPKGKITRPEFELLAQGVVPEQE